LPYWSLEVAGRGWQSLVPTPHPPVSVGPFLHAKDPQGVYSTSLGSSVGWTCVGNGVSQGSGPSLAVLNTQISQPNSDGKVPTEAVNATNGSMGPFDCQAGYTLSGATLTFFGEGQNYFNGVTKGQLVLVFP
jgi:hypothetical protein